MFRLMAFPAVLVAVLVLMASEANAQNCRRSFSAPASGCYNVPQNQNFGNGYANFGNGQQNYADEFVEVRTLRRVKNSNFNGHANNFGNGQYNGNNGFNGNAYASNSFNGGFRNDGRFREVNNGRFQGNRGGFGNGNGNGNILNTLFDPRTILTVGGAAGGAAIAGPGGAVGGAAIGALAGNIIGDLGNRR